MSKLFRLFFCFTIFSLFGCVTQPQQPTREPVTWTKSQPSAEEIENAKAVVANELKDPNSAIFGNFWALDGTNGLRNICGYVNAKNSFGGYTGKKMFILMNSQKLAIEGSGVLGQFFPDICMPRTVK